MKYSSRGLINAVLSEKVFRHPDQKVLRGDYKFVRFNHDDGTVSLDNCETGERVEVNKDAVFLTMKTSITKDYLEMLFHGANYKKPAQSQPSCTEDLERIKPFVDKSKVAHY